MRYMMKQKVFSLADSFTINDENGTPRFKVAGKVFTIGKKLSLQDLAGRELVFIKQKVLAWRPMYELFRDGKLAAVVKRDFFAFFRARFTMAFAGGGPLEVQGSFLDYDYRITRNGLPVAHVSKKWFSWSDTYGVDVAEGEDDVLLLAAAVVIDMVCHSNKKAGIALDLVD